MSWFILLIQLVAVIFFIINDNTHQRYYYALGIIVVLTLLFYPVGKKKIVANKFTWSFAVLAITWFLTAQYWFALVTGILLLLQYMANRKLELLFFDDKIVAPGFGGRTFQWKSFSNIILKDGLLTLDYKNNRISQYYLDDDKGLPDEREFNDFCNRQLSVANRKAG